MSKRQRLTRAFVVSASAATIAGLATPAGSLAISLPERTFLISLDAFGRSADGASQNPALSATGRIVIFDTTATTLAVGDGNGAIRDVVSIDTVTGDRLLVSSVPGGAPSDGASYIPSPSRDGRRIAFVSEATNLVAGDTNGVADVIMRDGSSAPVLVSMAADGGPANGPSYEPDMSGDGRYVAFASNASNLVPGDTNGNADVFVRDLTDRTTIRVSIGVNDAQARGRSTQPAISDGGTVVAFESGAPNLVAADDNDIADVFVHDIRRGRTERVSVSTDGREQNRSVAPPFRQVSDIDRDGSKVVFESDATTLVRGDTNRHTDVFLRDRERGTTALVSVSTTNVQGDNDSFAPRLTPNGRYLAFESFASNLAVGDAPREDVFLRDLRTGTTAVATVAADNRPRGSERVAQLLQRPALSSDGRVAAFASSATNLVVGDANDALDVFLRRLDPPAGTLLSLERGRERSTVRVGADDSAATRFQCKLDGGEPYSCGRTVRVRRGAGYRLSMRAGGLGMLYDTRAIEVRLGAVDRRRPSVRVHGRARSRLPSVLRGTASDAGSGVHYVEIAVAALTRRGCLRLDEGLWVKTACRSLGAYARASGRRSWRFEVPRLRTVAATFVFARAVDRAGNRSAAVRVLRTTP